MARARKHAFACLLASLVGGLALPACSKSEAPPVLTTASPPCEAELPVAIASLGEAMIAGDWRRSVDLSASPRLIDQIIARAKLPAWMKITPEQIRNGGSISVSRTFDQVKILSWDMSISEAQFRSSPTGRGYALLPYSVDVEINGRTIHGSSVALAILEDRCWYILDIPNGKYLEFFRTTYPDLADLEPIPYQIEEIEQ